jgi:hypothetical protein
MLLHRRSHRNMNTVSSHVVALDLANDRSLRAGPCSLTARGRTGQPLTCFCRCLVRHLLDPFESLIACAARKHMWRRTFIVILPRDSVRLCYSSGRSTHHQAISSTVLQVCCGTTTLSPACGRVECINLVRPLHTRLTIQY